MNINHSAEYIALWKSHKRTEWEAERLEEQVSGLLKSSRPAVDLAPALAGSRAEGQVSGEGDGYGDGYSDGSADVRGDGSADVHDEVMARQLQQESRRMWQLRSEIGAELERVSEILTPGQRKSAEKMLKQWEAEQWSLRD